MKKITKRKDVIITTIIILVTGIIWLISMLIPSGEGRYAEIYVDGEVVLTVDLSDDNKTIEVPKVDGVFITLKDSKIGFTQSDCPEKICVETGFLHRAGEVAVCLPNKVTLKVVDTSEQSIDGIVGLYIRGE